MMAQLFSALAVEAELEAKSKKSISDIYDTVVGNFIFGLEFTQECKRGHKESTFQKTFIVPLSRESSLERQIEHKFITEKKTKFFCQECDLEVKGRSSTFIENLPEVLAITFDMFEKNFGHKKGKNRSFSHTIDLHPYLETLLKKMTTEARYQLFAMINQEGKSRDSTSYTAIVLKKDNKWYKFGAEATTEILAE